MIAKEKKNKKIRNEKNKNNNKIVVCFMKQEEFLSNI